MSTGASSGIAWAAGGIGLALIIWQGFGLADLKEEVSDLSARMNEMERAAKQPEARARARPIAHRSLVPASEPSPRFVPERLDDEEPASAEEEEDRKEEIEAAMEEAIKRREQEKMDQWLEAQLDRNQARVQEAVEEGLVPARLQSDVLELLQGYSQSMWNRKSRVTDGEQTWQEARAQYVRDQADTHAALVKLIGEDAARKLGPGPPRQAPDK